MVNLKDTEELENIHGIDRDIWTFLFEDYQQTLNDLITDKIAYATALPVVDINSSTFKHLEELERFKVNEIEMVLKRKVDLVRLSDENEKVLTSRNESLKSLQSNMSTYE